MGLGRIFHRLGQVRALATLALLAMAIRAFVPAGFMPAFGEDGRFLAVVLCTGSGAVEAILDLKTGDAAAVHDDGSSTSAGTPCFFGATEHVAPPTPPAHVVLAQAEPHAASTVPATPSLRMRLAAPPPWATAPPHFS